MENIERTKSVLYSLYSRALGKLDLVQEPKGYDSDTRSYERNKDSRGILIKTKISLEFFGAGATYLTTIFRSFGISEKVLLTKYVRDTLSLSESWKFRYIQELDLGEWDEVSRQSNVTVDAIEGSLFSDIDNRKSDKYDILNNESADGVDIGALKTNRFIPQPRGIFLESYWDGVKSGYRLNSASIHEGQTASGRTIPFTEVYLSDKDNMQTPFNSADSSQALRHTLSADIGSNQNLGDFFYWRSDIRRTIRVKLDLEFSITSNDVDDIFLVDFGVDFRKSEKVGEFDQLKELEILSNFDPRSEVGVQKSLSFDEEITLEIGESLGFLFSSLITVDTQWFDDKGHLFSYISITQARLVVEDTTSYEVTESRCLKPFDLFERLVAKITGKNGLFKSTIFDVGGEYEKMVLDNGFWARGFPDVLIDSNGDERRIQFNTSFKEAYEAYNYLEPLAWFIEIVGDQEVVRMEKATYTMKNFIGLSLSAVDDIKSKSSKIDFFSRVIIGHKKSLEFDDINGLEEPNGRSEFNTHIKRNDSEYSIESEYRFDAVPYELTRRKNYLNFPKEDTKWDSDIWIHDAKVDNTGLFTHNLWPDRFDSAPTGIFDPDTAWNLWLTPMNRLYYGHGYSVIRGLYHFRNAKIRFRSSNANQNLKTIFNGIELHEGGNITIGDIENPLIEAEIPSLSFKMTQEIEDTLTGFTEIDGELVPNFFGLIEYLEKGDLRYGRLTKLDGDKESNLIMQKARL